MIDAVLAVGRDCDCGHPLVWRMGRQMCAVYGRHPAEIDAACFADAIPERVAAGRNTDAPFAGLVDLVAAAPNTTRIAVYARHVHAEARRRAALRAVS